MCTFGANTLTLRTVWGKYSMSEQALYRLLRFFCAKSERAHAAASFLRVQVRIGISRWHLFRSVIMILDAGAGIARPLTAYGRHCKVLFQPRVFDIIVSMMNLRWYGGYYGKQT